MRRCRLSRLIAAGVLTAFAAMLGGAGEAGAQQLALAEVSALQ